MDVHLSSRKDETLLLGRYPGLLLHFLFDTGDLKESAVVHVEYRVDIRSRPYGNVGIERDLSANVKR